MADFLSLIGAIPGLMSDFSGGTSAPYRKQQEQLAQQQMANSQALSQGPGNPLYQQLYGQYKTQGAQNLGAGVAELQAQNRMNSNMGRTPLLNDERGSENIFRNIMQGYQDLGTQADAQTRDALMGGMRGTAAASQNYNDLSKFGQAGNAQELSGYGTIYNLLRGLGGNNQNNGLQTPGGVSTAQQPQQQMYQPQANWYR